MTKIKWPWLWIDQDKYRLDWLNPNPQVASRAIRLTRKDGSAVYDVACFPHGIECDCPAGTMRPERGLCKHALAVKELLSKRVP